MGLEAFGAGDGSRTRNPQLGRLILYQLSYSRSFVKKSGGERRIRTFVGVSQRIYSPSPLATRASLHEPLTRQDLKNWSWLWDLNPQPADYKSAALPIELNQPIEIHMCMRLLLRSGKVYRNFED
jgi:hypothetical protein